MAHNSAMLLEPVCLVVVGASALSVNYHLDSDKSLHGRVI